VSLKKDTMNENYLVFTRKFRPQDFDAIMGQDQVVIPLKRAIELNRVMHAYIFSGPRGVGKTTTARVLAKALNCKEGPTVNPCGKCPSCEEIKSGSSMDVIEIDGASNRGIDRIRELREQVGFSASGGKYKVYIIDEVHMLTTEAFNALLKTLEEPPKHVIFVLATTDPQNIPQTILSRCQHFRFKRAAIGTITENIRMIAKKENIQYEDKALYEIAKAADGAMRDGQRIFDQAVTYAGPEKLTSGLVAEMLGSIETDRIQSAVSAFLKRDMTLAIREAEAVIESGHDIRNFIRGIQERLRNILVLKTTGDVSLIQASDTDIELMKAEAQDADMNDIMFMLQKAIDAENRVSRSFVPGIALELFMAEAVAGPVNAPKTVTITVNHAAASQAAAGTSGAQQKQESVLAEKEEAPAAESEKTASKEEQPEKGLVAFEIEEEEKIEKLTKEVIERRWESFCEKSKGVLDEDTQSALIKAGIVSFDEPVLTILGENPFTVSILKKNTEQIKQALSAEFREEVRPVFYEKNEYRKKYQVQKEVTQEEAMNNPVIKNLGTVFKIKSVEVKKSGGNK